MKPALDRARLRKLLALLGSEHDGEALNAARRIDAAMRSAGMTWQALLPDEPGAPAADGDLIKLDELLASNRVADVLKLRLADMRRDLRHGRLGAADRRLLRVLHRKAVIDGVILEA